MSAVPEDVLRVILDFLDVESLAMTSMTCRSLRNVAVVSLPSLRNAVKYVSMAVDLLQKSLDTSDIDPDAVCDKLNEYGDRLGMPPLMPKVKLGGDKFDVYGWVSHEAAVLRENRQPDAVFHDDDSAATAMTINENQNTKTRIFRITMVWRSRDIVVECRKGTSGILVCNVILRHVDVDLAADIVKLLRSNGMPSIALRVPKNRKGAAAIVKALDNRDVLVGASRCSHTFYNA